MDQTSLKKSFGKRFKELRNSLGYTQPQLIEAFKKDNPDFETSVASISQYENGKRIPEIPDLVAWSNFFNVSSDYLLGKTFYKNNKDFDNKAKSMIEKLSKLPQDIKNQLVDISLEFNNLSLTEEEFIIKLNKSLSNFPEKYISAGKEFITYVYDEKLRQIYNQDSNTLVFNGLSNQNNINTDGLDEEDIKNINEYVQMYKLAKQAKQEKEGEN